MWDFFIYNVDYIPMTTIWRNCENVCNTDIRNTGVSPPYQLDCDNSVSDCDITVIIGILIKTLYMVLSWDVDYEYSGILV